MPRRFGWLHDYEIALDQGKGVLPEEPMQGRPHQVVTKAPAAAPNITININLGDLLSQVVKGKKSTKEALDEMIESSKSTRQRLDESTED